MKSRRKRKNDCGIFASVSGVVRVSEKTAPPQTSHPFAQIHDASSIGCCTRTFVSPREYRSGRNTLSTVAAESGIAAANHHPQKHAADLTRLPAPSAPILPLLILM